MTPVTWAGRTGVMRVLLLAFLLFQLMAGIGVWLVVYRAIFGPSDEPK